MFRIVDEIIFFLSCRRIGRPVCLGVAFCCFFFYKLDFGFCFVLPSFTRNGNTVRFSNAQGWEEVFFCIFVLDGVGVVDSIYGLPGFYRINRKERDGRAVHFFTGLMLMG